MKKIKTLLGDLEIDENKKQESIYYKNKKAIIRLFNKFIVIQKDDENNINDL